MARHASRAASNTAPKAPAGRSRSRRSLPASCAGTCRPSDAPQLGGVFRGARGGPLSESLYGRIWHQARAAAIPEDGTGTQPVRRPCDLRHAALSLWLASGAPPAEIAARAGHSVRVLLTIYAHGIPGCDQIASQQIEEALRPSQWPPAGPQKRRRRHESRPSCVRATAGPSGTQLDLKPPPRSSYMPVTCGKTDRCGRFHGSRPRTADPRYPIPHKPLTSPDLAHHWPTDIVSGLPNRSRTRIRPGLREHRNRV